jgi:opacity protein-like surface antigen
MHVLRSPVVRLGAVLLLAVAVMAAAYGFAATNTVPDTRAGDGAGTISGYTGEQRDLHSQRFQPAEAGQGRVHLDAAASTVKVRLWTTGTLVTHWHQHLGQLQHWSATPPARASSRPTSCGWWLYSRTGIVWLPGPWALTPRGPGRIRGPG